MVMLMVVSFVACGDDGGGEVTPMDARDNAGAQESAPAEDGRGGLPEVVDVAELPDVGGGNVQREVVEAAQRFGAQHADHFAGLLLAQGRVWVGFTAEVEAHLAGLRAEVADTSLVGAFRARFTEAEMRGLQAEITRDMSALRAEGVKVSMVGVSVLRNRVQVGIEDENPAAVKLLLDRYGHDRVYVSTSVVIRPVRG